MGQWLRFHVYTAAGAFVPSLAGELRSCMPYGTAKKKEEKLRFCSLMDFLCIDFEFFKYFLKILYIMFIMVFDASLNCIPRG